MVGGTYETDIDTPEVDRPMCDAFLQRMQQVFCGIIEPCGLTNPAAGCAP